MSSSATGRSAHVLVVGNEKGGSGKTTTALHICVSLLKKGLSVAVIDLDARQKSLTRYLENRSAFMANNGMRLDMPGHRLIARSQQDGRAAAQAEDEAALDHHLAALAQDHDAVIIDCPGADTDLARLAHARADTIVTPINDSYVDLDLLARVRPDTYGIIGPSLYAEMVWEARKQRAVADRGTIDWIVCRNRTQSLNARNKRRIKTTLQDLSKRIGFRYLDGLAERVIYKELFLQGLTLLDLREPGVARRAGAMTLSHVAARQEVRHLVEGLGLDHLDKQATAMARAG